MTTPLVRTLLVAAAFLTAGADASLLAQPAPSEGAEARWRRLTPEQRALVKERYRAWQRMEPERRRAVEERHEALRSLRERVLSELPEEERARFAALDGRARKRALRPHLERRLDELRAAMSERLGGEAFDRRTVRRIERALRDRTGDRLAELEEAGILPEGEAERLLGLSPVELGRELRRLNRQAVLRDPPKELLLLPEAERERLLQAPPDELLERLRELRAQGARAGPLPRALREAAEGRPRPHRPPPREVLEQVLTPGEMQELQSLDRDARVRRIHELLHAKARAAHERSGRGPERWEKLEALPPRLQQRRYLKLIDPELDVRRGRRPPR